mmetsp:Transcript_3735/g.9014  ORF Transcript_3735/g.9014 Transcript_3735/m.9014 type:complete len:232 (+) Transcript_3735:2549-3244(+)
MKTAPPEQCDENWFARSGLWLYCFASRSENRKLPRSTPSTTPSPSSIVSVATVTDSAFTLYRPSVTMRVGWFEVVKTVPDTSGNVMVLAREESGIRNDVRRTSFPTPRKPPSKSRGTRPLICARIVSFERPPARPTVKRSPVWTMLPLTWNSSRDRSVSNLRGKFAEVITVPVVSGSVSSESESGSRAERVSVRPSLRVVPSKSRAPRPRMLACIDTPSLPPCIPISTSRS